MIYTVTYFGFSDGSVLKLYVEAENEKHAISVANRAKAIRHSNVYTTDVYVDELKIWGENDFNNVNGLKDLDKVFVYWKNGRREKFESNEIARRVFEKGGICYDFREGDLLQNNKLIGIVYGEGVRDDEKEAKRKLGLN